MPENTEKGSEQGPLPPLPSKEGDFTLSGQERKRIGDRSRLWGLLGRRGAQSEKEQGNSGAATPRPF